MTPVVEGILKSLGSGSQARNRYLKGVPCLIYNYLNKNTFCSIEDLQRPALSAAMGWRVRLKVNPPLSCFFRPDKYRKKPAHKLCLGSGQSPSPKKKLVEKSIIIFTITMTM